MFCILIVLLSLTSQPAVHSTTKDIEKAFLQNDAGALFFLFDTKSSIIISLPGPISFSDQISNQQAYFLFKKIFHSYSTLEFYSIDEIPANPGRKDYFFKGRWSFRNKRNKNLYVYHIFFYLTQRQDGGQKGTAWKIFEMKADKI